MDDPRYPIGRLEFDTATASERRADWIEELAQAPAALRQAVAGLDDERLDTPYREGGWTVRQLVPCCGAWRRPTLPAPSYTHSRASSPWTAWWRFTPGMASTTRRRFARSVTAWPGEGVTPFLSTLGGGSIPSPWAPGPARSGSEA